MQDANHKQTWWLETKKAGSVLIIKFLVRYFDLVKHPPQEYKNLLSAAYQEGYEGVVIDLDNVEFANSTWGPIDQAIFAAKVFSGQVALCNLRPQLEELFKLCRLNEVLTLCKSEEEAIDAILKTKRRQAHL